MCSRWSRSMRTARVVLTTPDADRIDEPTGRVLVWAASIDTGGISREGSTTRPGGGLHPGPAVADAEVRRGVDPDELGGCVPLGPAHRPWRLGRTADQHA